MPIAVTPYIPTNITVHLGLPSQSAPNVTVSFPDYIKNVASSEIYPTWEPSAIRANVLAQISFALNRVYTEFYVSQGYDFDITSTTAYDQRFIRGRNIFENVAEIVDEIFNNYIRRIGFVEPLSAKFCNGTTTKCDGLSQWGSQELAQRGYNSVQILRHYYGDNVELVVNAPLQDPQDSYPGSPLRRGDTGEYVLVIQAILNRVSQNYPAIPKIWPAVGVFNAGTEEAVRTFQRIFNLTVDGIVGKATWYRLIYLHNSVLRLSELASQGQRNYRINYQYPGPTSQGQSGEAVRTMQYMLAVVGEFYEELPVIQVDGVFGPETADAVRAFQRYAGLTVDGIAGAETWSRLYWTFVSLENGYLQNGALFPAAVQTGATVVSYGQTSRAEQFPGYDLTLGQSDQI